MYTFLALGDSYTIGEDVPLVENFPTQLVAQLRNKNIPIADPRILAQTGWRTDQLMAAIADDTTLSGKTFSLVTLCIGVNNQYQHIDFGIYEKEFEMLLHTAILLAGRHPECVLVLSIPDWAWTTYGQNFTSEPFYISTAIDQYNAFNRAMSEKMGVQYINVTEISRQGLEIPNMLAPDGLHPSGQQYARWVEILKEKALKVLK